MNKTPHTICLAQRKAIIEQCVSRPQGMTVREWLKEKHIPEKRYYYWQRKVRKVDFESAASSLVPVTNSEDPAAYSFVEINSHIGV